jgi:hypothetical protein
VGIVMTLPVLFVTLAALACACLFNFNPGAAPVQLYGVPLMTPALFTQPGLRDILQYPGAYP